MTMLANNRQTLTSDEYRSTPVPSPGTSRDEQDIVIVPSQLAPVVDQLQEILALREGWNSYRASPIRPMAALAALKFLVDSKWSGTLPSVFPTSRGGVKLEWDHDDDSVEFTFGPDGSVSALVDVNGEMSEGQIQSNDDPFLSEALIWAEKLS